MEMHVEGHSEELTALIAKPTVLTSDSRHGGLPGPAPIS
jgi:hypothetical protein